MSERTPMFLFLLTEFKAIVGAFLDCTIRQNKAYIGDNGSFVFVLEPFLEIYKSTSKNNMYAHVC